MQNIRMLLPFDSEIVGVPVISKAWNEFADRIDLARCAPELAGTYKLAFKGSVQQLQL